MPTDPAGAFGYILALIISVVVALALVAGLVLGLLWLASRGFMLRDRRRIQAAENRLHLAQIEAATHRAEEGERG